MTINWADTKKSFRNAARKLGLMKTRESTPRVFASKLRVRVEKDTSGISVGTLAAAKRLGYTTEAQIRASDDPEMKAWLSMKNVRLGRELPAPIRPSPTGGCVIV